MAKCTDEGFMSAVIGVSSIDVLKSSMNVFTKLYVSECRNACKSVGEIICFVGTVYRSLPLFLAMSINSILELVCVGGQICSNSILR